LTGSFNPFQIFPKYNAEYSYFNVYKKEMKDSTSTKYVKRNQVGEAEETALAPRKKNTP